MKTAIAIPARLKSTRFPKKVLADLCGKPVVQWVYEVAQKAGIADEIYVLYDADEIGEIVSAFGGHGIKTSPDCCCGTDRIVSVLDKIDADFIMNIQGDEPLLDYKLLVALNERAKICKADILTPVFKITDVDDIDDPSRVKVAISKAGQALYFSRSAIPFVRGVEKSHWLEKCEFFGHIGVYGYRRKVLENYKNLHNSAIEEAESLEQLRFLDNGYRIDTIIASQPTIGIDTPEDLIKAISYANKNL